MKTENTIFSGKMLIPLKPLYMKWNPQEDITTYELAKCIPFIAAIRPIMPYELGEKQDFHRHFIIEDPNTY